MIYEVEEIKTKKTTKLVIVYFIVLLLVLFVAIEFGMYMAKKYNENKTSENNISQVANDNKDENSNNAEKNKSEVMVIVEQQKNQQNFIKSVNNIYNEKSGKRVFLTFDDGPSEAVTPYILNKLKEYNIKATFFVLGSRVKSNPELVKRAYNEGHYIANHGYSHRYDKIYASSNDVLKEYIKTDKEIQKALGNTNYYSNLFRFPGGSSGGEYEKTKKQAKKELTKNRIAYLDWNALTNDSAGANTKKKIIKNLKETVKNKNNVVVLMHDAPDKILTYETLDEVIKYLKDKGYTFKNMYDLM